MTDAPVQVIRIRKDGSIFGLGSDLLDNLKQLGKAQVERVSEVDFNPETGNWEAISNGVKIAEDPIRSVAIRMEQEYFRQKIQSGELGKL